MAFLLDVLARTERTDRRTDGRTDGNDSYRSLPCRGRAV